MSEVAKTYPLDGLAKEVKVAIADYLKSIGLLPADPHTFEVRLRSYNFEAGWRLLFLRNGGGWSKKFGWIDKDDPATLPDLTPESAVDFIRESLENPHTALSELELAKREFQEDIQSQHEDCVRRIASWSEHAAELKRKLDEKDAIIANLTKQLADVATV